MKRGFRGNCSPVQVTPRQALHEHTSLFFRFLAVQWLSERPGSSLPPCLNAYVCFYPLGSWQVDGRPTLWSGEHWVPRLRTAPSWGSSIAGWATGETSRPEGVSPGVICPVIPDAQAGQLSGERSAPSMRVVFRHPGGIAVGKSS